MIESKDHPDGQDPSDKGQPPEMAAAPLSSRRYRVGFYVDGFNLYHAIDQLGDDVLKWLDVGSLARSFLRQADDLARVVVFTALNTWDASKRQRHVNFVTALQGVGVEVRLSKFDSVDRYCNRHDRSCPFKEEKQTDVGVAVEVLSDCYDNKVDNVFVVTADSDHVPLFRHIRDRFPAIRLYLVAPPRRLSIARHLGGYAHQVFELSAMRLRQHPLPINVTDAKGRVIATAPAKYGIR